MRQFTISLEGGEGSGKGTIIKGLKELFPEAVFTREPGGTNVGEEVREIIMNNDLDLTTEAMLFASARARLIEEVIKPSLNKGKSIILDRYVHSSYVYQGMVKGLGLERVVAINNLATGAWLPDKTILLDIDPEVGLKRIADNLRETNRFDKEGIIFHRKIRESYLKLAKRHREQMFIVNADQSPDKVLEDVLKIINS